MIIPRELEFDHQEADGSAAPVDHFEIQLQRYDGAGNPNALFPPSPVVVSGSVQDATGRVKMTIVGSPLHPDSNTDLQTGVPYGFQVVAVANGERSTVQTGGTFQFSHTVAQPVSNIAEANQSE